MKMEKDLELLIRQEQGLVFERFDEEIAWRVGSLLHDRAAHEHLPIAIDIRLFDRPLFFAAMAGAVFDNVEWIRRKTNTVQRFLKSSYRVAHELALEKNDIVSRYHLSPMDYVACGGAFPIIAKAAGVIGSITVSGLPDRQDHHIVVDVLCDCLGKRREDFALPPE